MSKTGDELKLMAELSMLFIGTSEVLNDLINLRGTTISSPLLGNAAAFICDKPEDEEYIKHLSEFRGKDARSSPVYIRPQYTGLKGRLKSSFLFFINFFSIIYI